MEWSDAHRMASHAHLAGDRMKPSWQWNLSERECEVLDALCENARYKAAGKLLGITDRTIQLHMRRIKRKMECQTRTAALANWFLYRMSNERQAA